MHVALLADRGWLDESLTLLRYLAVGLVDDRVRVQQVVPEGIDLSEVSVFGQQLTFRETNWPGRLQRRIAKLRGPLQGLGVELVHALSCRVWGGATALASAMDAPAVLTVNAASDLDHVARAAAALPEGRGVLLAATDPLAEAARASAGDHAPVEAVRPGVHAAAVTAPTREPDEPLCVVVTGSGELDADYESFLVGLAQLVRERPRVQCFIDSQSPDQHRLWQACRRLHLLGHVSLIPRRLGHREILLRAHVMAQPQPLGAARMVTLQAFAHGVAVLAAEDPWLDYLHHDQTAWVLHDADPDAWTAWLMRVYDDPAAAAALGGRARAWVGEHRVAADFLTGVLRHYRGLMGESLQFDPAAA